MSAGDLVGVGDALGDAPARRIGGSGPQRYLCPGRGGERRGVAAAGAGAERKVQAVLVAVDSGNDLLARV